MSFIKEVLERDTAFEIQSGFILGMLTMGYLSLPNYPESSDTPPWFWVYNYGNYYILLLLFVKLCVKLLRQGRDEYYDFEE